MGVLDPKLLQAKRLADAKRAALEQQEAETEKINRRCERGFEALLQAKMDAVQRGLIPFHHAFSERQNVSLEVDTGREEVPKIDEVTVAEVEHLVEPGQIDPDHIITPGVFVKRIVHVPNAPKHIEQRSTRKRTDPAVPAGTGEEI